MPVEWNSWRVDANRLVERQPNWAKMANAEVENLRALAERTIGLREEDGIAVGGCGSRRRHRFGGTARHPDARSERRPTPTAVGRANDPCPRCARTVPCSVPTQPGPKNLRAGCHANAALPLYQTVRRRPVRRLEDGTGVARPRRESNSQR